MSDTYKLELTKDEHNFLLWTMGYMVSSSDKMQDTLPGYIRTHHDMIVPKLLTASIELQIGKQFKDTAVLFTDHRAAPCPFCGAHGIVYTDGDGPVTAMAVRCSRCSAKTLVNLKHNAFGIEEWNKRVQLPEEEPEDVPEPKMEFADEEPVPKRMPRYRLCVWTQQANGPDYWKTKDCRYSAEARQKAKAYWEAGTAHPTNNHVLVVDLVEKRCLWEDGADRNKVLTSRLMSELKV